FSRDWSSDVCSSDLQTNLSMKKILVPTDFSAQAENALKVAAQLARKHKSEIYLLHMLELPLGLVDQTSSGGGSLPESLFFMKLRSEERRVGKVSKSL